MELEVLAYLDPSTIKKDVKLKITTDDHYPFETNSMEATINQPLPLTKKLDLNDFPNKIRYDLIDANDPNGKNVDKTGLAFWKFPFSALLA